MGAKDEPILEMVFGGCARVDELPRRPTQDAPWLEHPSIARVAAIDWSDASEPGLKVAQLEELRVHIAGDKDEKAIATFGHAMQALLRPLRDEMHREMTGDVAAAYESLMGYLLLSGDAEGLADSIG
jgi:hypothetical protein